jgi:hypothetical protein
MVGTNFPGRQLFGGSSSTVIRESWGGATEKQGSHELSCHAFTFCVPRRHVLSVPLSLKRDQAGFSAGLAGVRDE